jgi:hypothetical protein
MAEVTETLKNRGKIVKMEGKIILNLGSDNKYLVNMIKQ